MAASNATLILDDIMIGSNKEGVIRAQSTEPEWVEYKDKRGEHSKAREIPTALGNTKTN